ncbi:MAG: type II secretion system F family protein, partial [Candidatus Omnitrophica bacterium]|nr:type II secretion system F family protein [Candidatus Omnitrophota bacterium]
MPSFEYSARDRSSGKTVQGIIEAVSQVEGLGILKDRGLLVTSINESRSRRKSTANKRKKKKRITIDDKVLFSRQMATMVNAGLPLIEGLSILGENIENGSFAAVINQIKSDVEGGDTLTDAMAKHPRVFDTLYVNLIRAGEAAGMLDQILLQLSTYLEKASSLQRKIKSAMIYPSVIVSVAVAVVTLLLIKVVPIFAEIFDSFDAELPAPTKLMIGASEFLQANFLYFLIGGVVGGFLF